MRKKKTTNKNGLRWVIGNSKRQIPKIIFLSVANIAIAAVFTLLALFSKYAIDAAQKAAEVSANSAYETYKILFWNISIPTKSIPYIKDIFFYAGIILIIITARLVLRVVANSLAITIQAKLEMRMRSKLFYEILTKEYSQISDYHSGELINRITSDIKIITDGVTTIVPELLFYVTQFVSAFVVLIYIAPRLTLVFVVAGVLVSCVTIFFRGKLKSLHKKVQESDGVVRSFFQEAIESLLVVKTFGVEKTFKNKGDQLQKINYKAKMKRRRIAIAASAGFGFIFNSGYLLALAWCAVKVATKAMSYGTLTAVLQLVSQLQTPFANVTKVIPQYYAIIASAERIIEIENIDPEENIHDIDRDKFYSKLDQVKIEDIKFDYGRESVIDQGNASFAKGDFVAIRGISGIGKSTLMKMLLGVFKPTEGSIKLYKTDGSSIVASPDTRTLFSYVPQGNYLFSGTLRENITLINPKATEEEIQRALVVSDIKEFVDKLPDGLETQIGENAAGISEGQAQRLAIARALVSKAPILLLDEATSALDANTEKRVLANIKQLEEKTCIIITHKKAALSVCNKEFRIEDKMLTCRDITADMW